MWKYAKHPDGPCTQMGVGISTKGGAVTPAWFYNRPLYPAHVDASDSEFGKLLPVSERVSQLHGESMRKFLILVVALTALSS